MAPYELLSAPGQIGKLTIKNRVSMSPMEKQWADRLGNPTHFYVDYMVERAKNDVGMITMEATFVDPRGRGNILQLGLWDDANIQSHRRLTDSVHKFGTVAVTELMHVGRQGTIAKTGFQPEAPSPIPCESSGGDLPRSLSQDDIQRIVESFAKAARRAVLAGYDMITIHGAHGYLVTSFLSPRYNRRNDEYGGNEEGRWRFPYEVYDAIRSEVGTSVPVGIRLSAMEDIEGGLTVPQSAAFVRHLAAHGLDYVDVSAGAYDSASKMVQPMDLGEGCLLPIAREMKSLVEIPVIAAGRINGMDLAEKALADGDADFVHMGRAFHCDPEIYLKSRQGRQDEVFRCIACNQCVGSVFQGRRMVCTVNPVAGRERSMIARATDTPKRVMVVGGGLAGMETARIAAERGHKVRIYEQEQRLGGFIRILSIGAHRGSWLHAAEDRISALRRSGAEVIVGRTVDPAVIREEKPDVLVLATGSRPFVPPYVPGIDARHVTEYQSIAFGRVEIGDSCLVVGGQNLGLSIAEYLSENGARVTIAEESDSLGTDVEGITRALLLDRISADPNIEVRLNSNVELIRDGSVILQSAGERISHGGIEQVVYAWRRDMNRDLIEEVCGDFAEEIGAEVHVIGDAVWPREPYEVIYEGARLGRAL